MNRFTRHIALALHLLQSENYKIAEYFHRYLQALRRPYAPIRKPIVWTPKFLLVVSIAIFFIIGTASYVTYEFSPGGGVSTVLLFLLFAWALTYIFPLFLGLGIVILLPLDAILKRNIISQAKRKLQGRTDLIVIGITGSYGKTTMKQILAAALTGKFEVAATEENMNTPLGVARFITRDIQPETKIAIVEMGAYKQGDIAELCHIIRPTISVLTGINESHLERFGSIENTIAAKFEIVREAAPDAFAVLNGDNDLVVRYAPQHLHGRRSAYFGSKNHERLPYSVKNFVFHDDGSGISFELIENGTPHYFKIPLLGEHHVGPVMAAVVIGRHLGMSFPEIQRGLAAVRPVPHRLQMIQTPGGALVIDDSYNGNPDGVRAALAVLQSFKNRRKIYITPGLIEMGTQAKTVHLEIGKSLSRIADMVVLIETSASKYIEQGLLESGFPKDKIKVFPNATKAHEAVRNMIQPKDVVLFQNDWRDNYY